MIKKKFFRKRTPEEMRDLNVTKVYTQRGLVGKIWDLNPKKEAIELRTPLIPAGFLFGAESAAQASRRDYKHGKLIVVDQPQTRGEAYDYPYIPLDARMKALDDALRNKKEEEINFIGITWQPVQGNDRRWRVVPFDVPIEGVKIYNYAVHRAGGIQVIDEYTGAGIVQKEGGKILCKVPSRTEGRERYSVNLVNVPIIPGKEANAIIWGLRSQYEEGREPERTTFLHHLRYEGSRGPKTSDVYVFGPHEVAAYLALIRKYWKGFDNTVPLTMNPFLLPAKAFAEYFDKLDNNVMIFDPTLRSNDKLRNLHLDEKCIMLARGIKAKGVWDTVFWDLKRDGPIKDYWE